MLVFDIAVPTLRLLPSLLAAGLAAVLPLPAGAAEDLAGYDRFTVTAAHRPTPVAASVWYPAAASTYRVPIGDNPVFQGTPAFVGAAIAPGRHPLVLLSHGSGGNMDGLGWLSSGLAQAGFVVLAVNHQGTTSGDSSPRRTLDLWERTADLSAALDQVLEHPVFSASIDPSRITALGFSLGGATALQLAGIRIERDLFGGFCEAGTADEPTCAFFRKGGVRFSALPEAIESDETDIRVGAVVAVDPAVPFAYAGESVAAFDKPALIVNLGARETRWKAVDAGPSGADLAGRMKGAEYAEFAPASHFTVLPVCKPGAAELLIQEGEDPICDDPEGTDRAAVHAAILERIVGFLTR